MSLLFMDSFDKYTVQSNPSAQMNRFWRNCTTASTIEVATAGAHVNTFEITSNGSVDTPTFTPNSNEGWAGVRFRVDANNTDALFYIREGSTIHCSLQSNGAGEFNMRRGPDGAGGTTLGTTVGAGFSAGIWFYMEFRWIISNTVGELEVHVGGNQVGLVTGVDTQNGGTAAWDNLQLRGWDGSRDTHWDDFYLLDNAASGVTGAPNDDFLGDVIVEAVFPDAAGATTELTPSAGSNFANIGDTADKPGPDDDTTYNHSDTAGLQDTYEDEPLTEITVDDIRAVQVSAVARVESGSRDARLILRDGGTDFYGAAYGLPTVYGGHTVIAEGDNPFAGTTQWTIANVNLLEPGFEVNT